MSKNPFNYFWTALFLGLLVLASAPFAPARAANVPPPTVDAPLAAKSSRESIVLAGGCFWGMQEVFEHVKGVTSVVAGYAGGTAETAHYEIVSRGDTGHAESVQVTYDPSQISLGKILQVYFSVAHDPTQRDRQDPDTGPQYRSSIFYSSAEQQQIAEAYIVQMEAAKIFPASIATEIVPLKVFYQAERYHQDYAKRNPRDPYIFINDTPKVRALEGTFPQLYIP